MKKLSEIYQEEFEFCKEKPRQNYVKIIDVTKLTAVLFYSDIGPYSKGLVFQVDEASDLSPVVYPEVNEWRVLYRHTTKEQD